MKCFIALSEIIKQQLESLPQLTEQDNNDVIRVNRYVFLNVMLRFLNIKYQISNMNR